MSEVFVVVLEDRHADVEIEAFASLDGALASFEKVLGQYERELARVPAGDQMTLRQLEEAGWIAHRTLTNEGDQVRVERMVVMA